MSDALSPFRVLFVCLGNICRSPAAEIIFKCLANQAKTGSGRAIESDSAGILSFHQGSAPDPRMLAALAKRGYVCQGICSRPVRRQDLESFDLILPMDDQNRRDLLALDPGGMYASKLVPMASFVKKFSTSEIPDPYYGSEQDFDDVVVLLEEGCSRLLEHLKSAR